MFKECTRESVWEVVQWGNLKRWIHSINGYLNKRLNLGKEGEWYMTEMVEMGSLW